MAAQREPADFECQLGCIESRTSDGEEERCELEVSLGQCGSTPQHVAQVSLRLDSVQLARSDEAEEVGGGFAWSSLIDRVEDLDYEWGSGDGT